MAVANNNAIPPQGTPGVADGRNPTLIPNFDKPVVGNGSGSGDAGGNQSPAAFLIANPRVDATATAAIGEGATSGDKLTIEYANPVLASQGLNPAKIAGSYTVVAGDTLASIAEALADAFNDQATAQNIDLRVDALAAVMTFRHSGPVGNLGTLSQPIQEAAKVTLGGTAHTGDRVGVLFTGPGLGVNGQLVQTSPTTGQTATQMGDALVTAIAANSTLAGLSITGSNSSGAVTLTIPAGDYNVSSWVNTITPTAVVGGTPDTGDVLTLTFTNAALPGGTHAVSYTTLVTDTTTALAAAGLLAAINGDAVLATAGITAALGSSTLTISYPAAIGQLRFARSVTGTLTITLTAAPTTTAVTTTTASEIIVFASGSTGAVPASATALLGGTETDGDVVSLVFTNAGVTGFPVTISHTAAGSESVAAIAAALNTAINASAPLKAAGVLSSVVSQTLTITQLGTIGNSTVLSYTQGGNSETVTFTPSNGHLTGGTGSFASAALTGGSGPVIAANNFNFSYQGQAQAFFYGQPYVLDYQYVTALVNSGEPIV